MVVENMTTPILANPSHVKRQALFVTVWSGACLKVGSGWLLVWKGGYVRPVTRVQWGFGSPPFCGNGLGSI